MKKIKCLLSALLLNFTLQVHADFCDQLPGNWQGTFTIKDPALCEMFDGCTHQIKAQVLPDNFFTDTNFEVNINPSAGVAEFFYIRCKNNDISPPYGFLGTLAVTCDLSDHCEIVYEDPKLFCKMTKIKA